MLVPAVALLQAPALGDLGDDVAVGDVEVRLGGRAPLQAVGLVEAAHDRQGPVALDLGLDGRDLAVEDRRARRCRLRHHGDRQLLADLEPTAGEGRAQRVAEHQLEGVGQVDLVLDGRLEEGRRDLRGDGSAVDLDLEDVGRQRMAVIDLRRARRRRRAGAAGARDQVAGRNGSSSRLAEAIARHNVGDPYSSVAMDASVSPSTTR